MNELDLTMVVLILTIACGVPAAVWFGVGIGRMRIADEVEELWDRNGGWIPGASIGALEGVLGRPLLDARALAGHRFGPAATCAEVVDAEVVEDRWDDRADIDVARDWGGRG